MSAKRDLILAAMDAAQQQWQIPIAGDKTKITMIVVLEGEYAKALVDAAKIALAMIDRAAEVSEPLKDLKE